MRVKNEGYYRLIINYIDSYREQFGGSPCVREVADGTNIPRSTVSRYLNDLKNAGTIDFEGHRNIVTKEAKELITKQFKVPVLGRVACGLPQYAEENIEEYVSLPKALFGEGDFYFLRADGSSMIEAGIDDGDLVLIRHQNTAKRGEIVVALVDDEATLKRFFPEPEKHRIRLHPENSAMDDIFVPNCEIQGVAVKVIKDLI